VRSSSSALEPPAFRCGCRTDEGKSGAKPGPAAETLESPLFLDWRRRDPKREARQSGDGPGARRDAFDILSRTPARLAAIERAYTRVLGLLPSPDRGPAVAGVVRSLWRSCCRAPEEAAADDALSFSRSRWADLIPPATARCRQNRREERMSSGGTVVTLTQAARSKIRDFIATEGGDRRHLRIALVRTGCMGGRGFTYQLALQDSPSENDEVFEDGGVSVCVDQASSSHLSGAELDYVDTREASGFKLDNPNAIAQCPCGHHDIFE
jgi:iron-sulfur cluster insertion protein